MGTPVRLKALDGIGGRIVRVKEHFFDGVVREGLAIWIAREETVRTECQLLFGPGHNLGI